MGLCLLPLAGAVTYSFNLLRADWVAAVAMRAAQAADVKTVLQQSRICSSIKDYQTDYLLLSAQALELLATEKNDADSEKYPQLALEKVQTATKVTLEP
ncbi:MAG: hypothetical protein RMM17_13255 [Acidobacteriota bacterium]|nr:hypothetical protein [Blastocatellia bacterium]MDW8413635.1 hypothetical protein [Acidobacteriota bacterium]